MKVKKWVSGGMLSAVTVLAPQAFAETVGLTHQGWYYGAVEQTITRNPDGKVLAWGDVDVGGLKAGVHSSTSTLFTEGSTLLAWSIAVYPDFYTPQTRLDYDVREGAALDKDWVPLLERLFNKHRADAATDIGSAAMQLAIWKLVFDGDQTGNGEFSPSLIVPSFMAESRSVEGSYDAWMQANRWLSSLNDGTAVARDFQLIQLEAPQGYQSLVTFVSVAEVPLPGAALLFLSALGAGGWQRRRLWVRRMP